MSIIKRKAGCEDIVKSVLEFDEVPTEGSHNMVESGAVAKFTDSVPEGTTPENPLVNESALADVEEVMLTNIPCADNTLRFEFSKTDYNPIVAGVGSSGTWKKLNAKFLNVWDWTKSSTSFTTSFQDAFKDSDNFVSVIAAGDTSANTVTYYMFSGCTSLTSVVLFDTSNVTNMRAMFNGCSSLKSIPLFNVSKSTTTRDMFSGCTSLKSIPLFNLSSTTDSNSMFKDCTKVEGGALALYQQASSQTTPPSQHTDMFKNCGKNTETGAAELAQIPQSWGGTMPNP